MSLTIRIPAPLRERAGGARTLPIDATTLADLRRGLADRYPDLAAVVLDGDAFGPAVSVFVDGEDVRFLPEDADLRSARLVELLPAMSGG
ncbi:MAG: MoaD/ThiS family protein [Candidatus Limnocylindria bacterium]